MKLVYFISRIFLQTFQVVLCIPHVLGELQNYGPLSIFTVTNIGIISD